MNVIPRSWVMSSFGSHLISMESPTFLEDYWQVPLRRQALKDLPEIARPVNGLAGHAEPVLPGFQPQTGR